MPRYAFLIEGTPVGEKDDVTIEAGFFDAANRDEADEICDGQGGRSLGL
jgi:hypothetical protein